MHVTVTGSGPTVLRRQLLLRLEVGERLAEFDPEHRQCADQGADADHGIRGAAGHLRSGQAEAHARNVDDPVVDLRDPRPDVGRIEPIPPPEAHGHGRRVVPGVNGPGVGMYQSSTAPVPRQCSGV